MVLKKYNYLDTQGHFPYMYMLIKQLVIMNSTQLDLFLSSNLEKIFIHLLILREPEKSNEKER